MCTSFKTFGCVLRPISRASTTAMTARAQVAVCLPNDLPHNFADTAMKMFSAELRGARAYSSCRLPQLRVPMMASAFRVGSSSVVCHAYYYFRAPTQPLTITVFECSRWRTCLSRNPLASQAKTPTTMTLTMLPMDMRGVMVFVGAIIVSIRGAVSVVCAVQETFAHLQLYLVDAPKDSFSGPLTAVGA